MPRPEPQSPAPDFEAKDQVGKTHRLADYKGKKVVLFFYPKDDTPGCTKEACKFRDRLAPLRETGAEILGVSADSVESHDRFATKYNLPFPLLSDPDQKIIESYGVAKGDSAQRVSFLIGPDGKIVKVYPKVNPERHSEEVLADLQNLQIHHGL